MSLVGVVDDRCRKSEGGYLVNSVLHPSGLYCLNCLNCKYKVRVFVCTFLESSVLPSKICGSTCASNARWFPPFYEDRGASTQNRTDMTSAEIEKIGTQEGKNKEALV